MGVTAWSRNPDDNGTVDPLIRANDGVAARDIVRGQRGIMAAVKRMADDQGGALVSTGIADSFVVRDYSGTTELRAGVAFAFTPNRDNTGPANLVFNSLGSFPLLDRNGAELAPGALKQGRLVRVVYDKDGEAWRTTDLGLITNGDLAAGPEGTIKGNDGNGVADLAVDAVRTLLRVDHLPNKSEAEMVADGAIADALATKATGANIADALAPVIAEVATKATPADISAALVPVNANIATAQSAVASLQPRITLLETGQKSDRITRATWDNLSALTLVADATYESLEASGTHAGIASEAEFSNGQVPNGGIFIPIGGVLRRIGGTNISAIPQLVADSDTLRATRYVTRPGENIRGWTAQVDRLPTIANPLTVGGGYSISATAGGDALVLTGAVSAGPNTLTKVEPGKLYRSDLQVVRTINDPSLNGVRPRLRFFSNAKVDLGAFNVPGRDVLVADGVVTIPFTFSTVPGLGDVLFPDPTGGFARGYVAGQGTTGAIAIPSLTPPAPPVDLTSETAAAPAVTLPVAADTILLRRGSDGKTIKWSFADLEAYMAGPQQYVWPAHAVLGTENKIIIPDDPGIKEFGVYNRGPGRVHIAQGGLQAAVDGEGTVALNALGSTGTSLVAPGAVSAIGEAASKLTLFFKTTTPYNVAARAAAQSYIDRIVSRGVTLTTDQANALRDLYSELYACGALSVLGGFYNLCGPSAAVYMNLCDIPRGFADNAGGLTATSWRGVTFDGSTGWVDTRLKLAAIAAPNDFSLLAYPGDTTNQGSTRVAGGDGNVTLTPNRTNTTVAFRALGNTLYSPAGFTAGAGLLSVSRAEAANAVVRQKKASPIIVPISGSDAGFSDRTVLIGARNGGVTGQAASPATGSFFLGQLKFFGCGRHLTDAMHNAVSDACDKFSTSAGAF